MSARYRRQITVQAHEITSISELWMLRIPVPLGGHKLLLNRGGFSEDAVARGVGLGAWVDDDERDFDPAAVRLELRDLHRVAEALGDSLTLEPGFRAGLFFVEAALPFIDSPDTVELITLRLEWQACGVVLLHKQRRMGVRISDGPKAGLLEMCCGHEVELVNWTGSSIVCFAKGKTSEFARFVAQAYLSG